MKKNPPSRSRQRGVAVLLLAVCIVMVIGLLTINGTKTLVFGQKTSSNQYWSVLAHEAAQAGLEESLAWLNSVPQPTTPPVDCSTLNPWVSYCWVADGSSSSGTDQRLSTDRTVTTGNGFTSTVRFRRETVPLSSLNFVEIISRAVSNSDAAITATVRQTIYFSPFTGNRESIAHVPIMLAECIDDVTGTPDICPQNATGGSPCTASSGTPGVSIASLSTATPSTCLQTGHFNLHGGSIHTSLAAATVWSALFPKISKAEMKALSQFQANAGLTRTSNPKRSVYYYAPGAFVNDDHGSATEPVIVIVECGGNCPKVNGGTDIYGALYFDEGDSMQGWGNATVHGIFAVEGSIEKFTANTEFHYNAALTFALNPSGTGGVVPRIPGGWRDY